MRPARPCLNRTPASSRRMSVPAGRLGRFREQPDGILLRWEQWAALGERHTLHGHSSRRYVGDLAAYGGLELRAAR